MGDWGPKTPLEAIIIYGIFSLLFVWLVISYPFRFVWWLFVGRKKYEPKPHPFHVV